MAALLLSLSGLPSWLTVALAVCLQVAMHHQAQRQHRGRRGAGGLGAVLHPLLHGVPRGGGAFQVGILSPAVESRDRRVGIGQVMGNMCQLFHGKHSSDLGPFSLFGLKLLWCCCLMTCRVTPEADLVLKVPVSSAIKQQDCSGHDLHCFLASPMAPFIIHLCLGVPKARTHRALHCQARASDPLDHLVCGCGWQWEAVPSLSGLQITSLMGFLCQKSASNDPFILVN